MLRADGVSFAYGDEAVLDEITVSVSEGGLLGVLGPNGSGKTTLLKLLAGLLTPARGEVSLDGLRLHGFARGALARRLAVVPQETELIFDYTVLDVALMGRYPHLGPFEFEGPGDLDIARRMLDATGTAHLETRPFRTLSGGERQRVAIASALAQFDTDVSSPGRVLLLDEPTASLDLAAQLDIMALVARLREEHRTTVVLCTHDLNLAARLCDHLALLREGTLAAAGRTDEVLTRDTIAGVYGVEADVHRHEATDRLTVLPLRTKESA